MPKVTFIQPDGQRITVGASVGRSLMHTAIERGIDGIVADCGGACCCGTCHVYVEARWLQKLPQPDVAEIEMLGFVAAERRTTSRLSCQITVREEFDGMVVEVPRTQIAA